MGGVDLGPPQVLNNFESFKDLKNSKDVENFKLFFLLSFWVLHFCYSFHAFVYEAFA